MKTNCVDIDKVLSAESLSGCRDLTDKEREIIQLMWEGKSARMIGEQLGVSYKTVESHRANIFKKYRVNNLVLMLRVALMKHIIKVDLNGGIAKEEVEKGTKNESSKSDRINRKTAIRKNNRSKVSAI